MSSSHGFDGGGGHGGVGDDLRLLGDFHEIPGLLLEILFELPGGIVDDALHIALTHCLKSNDINVTTP